MQVFFVQFIIILDLALIFLYPKIKQGTINVVQSDTTKKMVEVLNGYLDKQLKDLNNDR